MDTTHICTRCDSLVKWLSSKSRSAENDIAKSEQFVLTDGLTLSSSGITCRLCQLFIEHLQADSVLAGDTQILALVDENTRDGLVSIFNIVAKSQKNPTKPECPSHSVTVEFDIWADKGE
jgi:hypothetical protein